MKFNSVSPMVIQHHDFLAAHHYENTTYDTSQDTDVRKSGIFFKKTVITNTITKLPAKIQYILVVERAPLPVSESGGFNSYPDSRDLRLEYTDKKTMLKDFNRVCGIIG